MVKRQREDGQLSKEEYEEREQSQNFHASRGTFDRATPSTMASRRVLRVRKPDRRKEYLEAVNNLNQRFAKWIEDQVSQNPAENLVPNMHEYLAYISQLNERYLRKQGEVFTFGSGECGQCAHGDESEADLVVTVPRVVYSLRNKNICQVACGGLHNAAVTTEGRVITWGCNDDKALGRDGDEKVPMVIESLRYETIIGVAAGDSHTIALTVDGKVFGWGCYKDKDNGHFFHPPPKARFEVGGKDPAVRAQAEPMLIPGLERGALEVAACGSFCMALLNNGTVLTWGIGESGQLGRKINLELKNEEDGEKNYNMQAIVKEHMTPWPMQLSDGSIAQGVRAIGCGQYHSLVIMALSSEVYATGLNNYGQLGLGDTDARYLLTHVTALDGREITAVTGGEHHTMALSGPTGRLYAFGRADSGQLGLGQAIREEVGSSVTLPERVRFPELKPGHEAFITSVSCGGSFTLATSNKHVYSWGYADMGATGHKPPRGVREMPDVVEPRQIDFTHVGVNEVDVLKVSAGGQHSVILAAVPVAFMDQVKRKLEEEDQKREAKRQKRVAQGLSAEEEEEEYGHDL